MSSYDSLWLPNHKFRFVSLSCPGCPAAIDEPGPDDPLPADDALWDEGVGVIRKSILNNITKVYLTGRTSTLFPIATQSRQHGIWEVCIVDTSFCSNVQSASTRILFTRCPTASAERRGTAVGTHSQGTALLWADGVQVAKRGAEL